MRTDVAGRHALVALLRILITTGLVMVGPQGRSTASSISGLPHTHAGGLLHSPHRGYR